MEMPSPSIENALASGGKGVANTGEAFAGWGFDVRWVRFQSVAKSSFNPVKTGVL
jgi:hypothetical protein